MVQPGSASLVSKGRLCWKQWWTEESETKISQQCKMQELCEPQSNAQNHCYHLVPHKYRTAILSVFCWVGLAVLALPH